MFKSKYFMKSIFKIILITFTLSLTSFTIHKYYSSITKIEVDNKDKLLKIHTQLFVDDFENVMQKRYDLTDIDFSNVSEKEQGKIKTYLTKKLQIQINRSPLELSYLGLEQEGELLYVYLESKLEQTVKRIDIENSLLQDFFSEQHNIVDVKNNKQVKSLHLHAENPRGTIFF